MSELKTGCAVASRKVNGDPRNPDVLPTFLHVIPKGRRHHPQFFPMANKSPRQGDSPGAIRTPVVLGTKGGSCGMFNVTSRTLAKVLGQQKIGDPEGVVGVELQHGAANGNSGYNTTNVQTATLVAAASNPANDC